MKKFLCIFFVLTLVLSSVSVFAQYTDTTDHWANAEIDKWSRMGIIKGDGQNFYPDAYITRGEFAVIIDRIMTYQTAANNTFTDLDDDFYTLPLLRLNQQDIVTGFDNKIRPNDCITRQEAAVMLCRALLIEPQDSFEKSYEDISETDDWAAGYMAAMSNKGYMQGSSGKLNPQSNITRGETVKILDNIIDNLLYENTEYDNISSENLCIINSKDAVISNSTFEGDVIVTAGAKALFKNSDIKGCLIALSPAKGSVKLENTGFGTLNAKNEYTVEIVETTNEEQTNDEPDKEQQTNENPQSPADSTETSPEGEFMPSISTTLQNGMVQKNSMKNFDVYALDASGAKIPCVVTFNTETIQPTWDDSEKTSYTLSFTQPGENTVVISATDNSGLTTEVSYTIIYEPAQYGEKIGEAVFCIEAFTVGGGYIITPVTVDVYEGVSAAYLLDQQLSSYGLGYNYSGSLDSGFYLFEINNIPDFAPIIPDIMTEMLSAYGYEVNNTVQKENALCEFDFTQGSGWMYCVNNLFPNVSISDYYPQDGDVIRILFTTAYGADVGGNNYAEYDPANDFFERTDRDALTRAIAQQGIENFTEYIDIITKPDITQEEIDSLIY